jgi:hypothetical protein
MSARMQSAARISARMSARIKCLFSLKTHATHALTRTRMRATQAHPLARMRATCELITRVYVISCVRCVRAPIRAGFKRADMRAEMRALRALHAPGSTRARAVVSPSGSGKK